MGKLNIPIHKNIPSPQEAYDDMMFGIKPSDTKELNISSLKAFEGQPFKPYTEDKMLELMGSINQDGLLSPIIVRDLNDGTYQILAGHNRVEAHKRLGIDTIKAIIKNVDEDTATLIMVNSNLNQRHELLPSEKAFAYKMQKEYLDKIKSGTLCPSTSIIAENNNTNRKQIFRYIRLTYLIKELLEMVDNKEIILIVGVELSYLSENNQNILFDYISSKNKKISLKQAEELRELEKINNFDNKVLDNFFNPRKEVKVPTAYKFKYKDIKEYIPEIDFKEEKEVQEYVNNTYWTMKSGYGLSFKTSSYITKTGSEVYPPDNTSWTLPQSGNVYFP